MAGFTPGMAEPRTYIRFDGLLGHVENVFNLIAASSILILMLMAVLQVLGRSIFNMPVPGFVDITEQAMAVFAFGGIAYCQRVGGHIRMEIVLGQLRGRGLWIAELVGVTMVWIVVTMLVVGTWFHFARAWNLGDSTMDISLPTWPSKLAVTVSLALLSLRLMMQMYGYARLIADPNREPVAVPVIQDATEVAQHEIEDALGNDLDEEASR